MVCPQPNVSHCRLPRPGHPSIHHPSCLFPDLSPLSNLFPGLPGQMSLRLCRELSAAPPASQPRTAPLCQLPGRWRHPFPGSHPASAPGLLFDQQQSQPLQSHPRDPAEAPGSTSLEEEHHSCAKLSSLNDWVCAAGWSEWIY